MGSNRCWSNLERSERREGPEEKEEAKGERRERKTEILSCTLAALEGRAIMMFPIEMRESSMARNSLGSGGGEEREREGKESFFPESLENSLVPVAGSFFE